MTIVRVTARQIEQRRRSRGEAYVERLAPAKLRDTAGGGAEYDADHPAWAAEVERSRERQTVERRGCAGCGGRSLITLAGDPAAMEAALAEG